MNRFSATLSASVAIVATMVIVVPSCTPPVDPPDDGGGTDAGPTFTIVDPGVLRVDDGANLEVQLTTDGGTAPIVFALRSFDTGLEWVRVSAAGRVFGVASNPSVTERHAIVGATEGEGRDASVELRFAVGACTTGATRECDPQVVGSQCLVGTSTCDAGAWSACDRSGGNTSTLPTQCYTGSTASCGDCGTSGVTCTNGACACGSDPDCDLLGSDKQCCFDSQYHCTSVLTDVNHCGSCENNCVKGYQNVTPSCQNAQCVQTCNAPFGRCGTDGGSCDIDFTSNDARCGDCATNCATAVAPNATVTGNCSNSQCDLTCAAGYENCDGDWRNGCEVNLKTDPNNCGGCRQVSTAYVCEYQGDPGSGAQICDAGTCDFQCSPGTSRCGTTCYFTTDRDHCASCDQSCRGDEPHVSSAQCQANDAGCAMTCVSGYADCNGKSGDGCEVNLTNDDIHCGTCGMNCLTIDAGVSEYTCVASTCTTSCFDINGSFACQWPNRCRVCQPVDPDRECCRP